MTRQFHRRRAFERSQRTVRIADRIVYQANGEHIVTIDAEAATTLARAAIESMRKPTELMARSFMEQADDVMSNVDFWPIEWYGGREAFDVSFDAMIDAALAPTPETKKAGPL